MDELDELTKSDIQWLTRFTKSVSHKRDPISRYERKARRYAIWRKVKTVFIILLAVAALAAGCLILKLLEII